MRMLSSVFSLQLALEYAIKFMETSAKANINVENVSEVYRPDLANGCIGSLQSKAQSEHK